MKKQIYLLLLFSFMLIGCESSILDDPSTIISFSISGDSSVKITVMNSYNTEVAVLVNGTLNPGNYSVNFQGDNLPEGIYYYIIEVKGSDGSISKNIYQLVLIK